MLGITQEEVDLLRTFTLTLKMKNHKKIVEHFSDKFKKDPDNLTNAFNYGTCLSAYILLDRTGFSNSTYQSAMNDAYKKCLEQKKEWWLVRYLRCEINISIPDEVTENPLNLPTFEKPNVDDDIKILLEQQKSAPKKFSYFLCPYMTQTKAYILEGKIDDALGSYKKGLVEVSIEKSPFDLPLLTWSSVAAIQFFKKLDMPDAADEIKKHVLILFPNAKNLQRA